MKQILESMSIAKKVFLIPVVASILMVLCSIVSHGQKDWKVTVALLAVGIALSFCIAIMTARSLLSSVRGSSWPSRTR
jgi:hypothetical protein